eukprot:scaffold250897_cov12-Tisochrysis_lutea.AAC.1
MQQEEQGKFIGGTFGTECWRRAGGLHASLLAVQGRQNAAAPFSALSFCGAPVPHAPMVPQWAVGSSSRCSQVSSCRRRAPATGAGEEGCCCACCAASSAAAAAAAAACQGGWMWHRCSPSQRACNQRA